MKKADLIELAQNSNLISGIYNYCDRWCERCPLTSRCFLYATEQADADLADPETELGQATRKYAMAVENWFKTEFDKEFPRHEASESLEAGEEELTIQNAIAVIRWYQFFIAAKTFRALSGRHNADLETEDDEELPDLFALEPQDDEDFDYDAVIASAGRRDAHGSAKVALIAVDRSISAWRSLQMSLPVKADSIKPMLIDLELLRRSMEARFPRARDFIRPGLDEVISDFVS